MPLTSDTPQCIHARHSSLEHTLTATLFSSDGTTAPFAKRQVVHTRRYSPHTLNLEISPRTRSLIHPTPVDAQVPRTLFKCGEPIPVYVTIPPPLRELVVDRGVRLRNIRVELVRVLRVREDAEELTSEESETDTEDEDDYHVPLADQKGRTPGSSTTPPTKGHSSANFPGAKDKTIISRSGGSCCFHSTQPVRMRFVLHPPASSDYPSEEASEPSIGEYSLSGDSSSECASVSQTSVLHAVSFRVLVHIGFVEVPARNERTMTISIPITILPPPAPLPEVEPSIDAAYHKKHDKPPAKTVRPEDTEHGAAPHYGEPGPSTGAPPPFEEREAPPPFFSVAESSSARLPTFLESETDTFMSPDPPAAHLHGPASHFAGEGALFGFAPADQFDGHVEAHGSERSASPPPTMEEARGDPDVTDLAGFGAQPDLANAMEALQLVLEQHAVAEDSPPPPPPMDDPSDPPPHIDSEFRTHSDVGSPQLQTLRHSHSGELPPHQSYTSPPEDDRPAEEAHSPHLNASQVGNAPPPYIVPEGEHEHAPGPPPYVG